MKVITYFSLIVFAFGGCNHAKDPCANVVCKDNQECFKGICQCVPESYNMGKWCAPKNSSTFNTFYSRSNNCNGYLISDTATVFLSRDAVTGTGGYSFMMAFPKDEKYSLTAVGAGEEGQSYFKRVDGDSFKIYKPSGLYYRDSNGKLRFPILHGKVSPLKDSLKLKIVWYDGSGTGTTLVPIDSCTKLFTR
jgi:hypothetical protein